MNSSEETPAGWDPEVFARIRAESESERAAMSPEKLELHDRLKDNEDGSSDSLADDVSDDLRERMRDVPGFDDELNPFPLTRKPAADS